MRDTAANGIRWDSVCAKPGSTRRTESLSSLTRGVLTDHGEATPTAASDSSTIVLSLFVR